MKKIIKILNKGIIKLGSSRSNGDTFNVVSYIKYQTEITAINETSNLYKWNSRPNIHKPYVTINKIVKKRFI